MPRVTVRHVLVTAAGQYQSTEPTFGNTSPNHYPKKSALDLFRNAETPVPA